MNSVSATFGGSDVGFFVALSGAPASTAAIQLIFSYTVEF
jgi:hypothetical protein